MPKKPKIFAIKLPLRRYYEFAVAAEMQGLTRAGYLHPLIIRLIRQERDRDPDYFDKRVDELISARDVDPLEPAGEIDSETR